TTINDLKKDLEEFKDADVSGMKKKIEDLEADIKTKDADHQREIADRDFNDLLKESITASKGRNAKAITALLDVETLKASKNQKEDIAAALKALTEAEDSKMLFGEPEPNPVGTGNIIGRVQKSGSNTEDAALRAAMGLPPVQEQK
ncbi:MAG: phage scaffolding protein, partial [Lachnospiraceae bacterium]|nr:phage scaffolding protein [Lachnospiraceae bacterium]